MTPSFLVQVGKFCIENIIKPAKKYFSTLHSRDLFYAYYKKLSSLASNMTYSSSGINSQQKENRK